MKAKRRTRFGEKCQDADDDAFADSWTLDTLLKKRCETS